MRINSIGMKLGLASLTSIALSLGMAANQMSTERSINKVNERAEAQQIVADRGLETEVALRRIEIASNELRLASTSSQVDAGLAAVHAVRGIVDQQIGIAMSKAVNAADTDQLSSIRALTANYETLMGQLATTLKAGFATIAKRQEFTTAWTKILEAQMASPAVQVAANRLEFEKGLLEADTNFNALRAATWHYTAYGEDSQLQAIYAATANLDKAVVQLRTLAGDKNTLAAVDSLAGIVRKVAAATDESLKSEKAKRDLLTTKAQPLAAQALTLMRTAVENAARQTETTKKQATQELTSANRINFALGMVVMISLVISMVFTFFGISRPLMQLNGALGKMAGGELNVRIPGAERGDEVGDIAKTVIVIRENADHRAREEAEQKAHQEELAAQQRKQDTVRLADSFEGAVGRIVETVSAASSELEASASSLASTADESQKLTIAVASASEIATSNVQSVASATEEMASSIREISRQVQDSARIANNAVQQAHKTNDRINQLANAAQRIGDVVELINTIAGQTNLLALNATIEAARAGEAGRGFAVVASEVKALAEQTAKATEEISQQISGMQAATEESVSAIKEIGTTITQMSEISSAISSAVEQQGAATQEISRNVQQAAQGTMQVSANIANVQRGASATGKSSTHVLEAARSLSSDSGKLKIEVERFLRSVRAA
jgi:methyl-accepting chemotaxis protein